MKNSTLILLAWLTVLGACTDLEPQIEEYVTGEEYINEARELIKEDIDLIGGFIDPSYTPLYQFIGERNIYALTEGSTDEMVTPTRGTDWADNGIWVQLHQHQWTSDHSIIRRGWNDLSSGVSRCYEVLGNMEAIAEGDIQFEEQLKPYFAEVRTLRAYYLWLFVDLFGQAPVLINGSPAVLQREEATDFVISELESSIPDMLSKAQSGEYGRVVKETAHALLAKVYLNRFIYTGTNVSSEDMQKVITHCDAVINSGSYALSPDYFGMFDQHNETSPETLLVLQNSGEQFRGFDAQTRVLMTLHYNQNAGWLLEPWNGMCTTETFFYSWDTDKNPNNGVQTNDSRFQDNRYLDQMGLHLGFLHGQQVDENGAPLQDRKGNALNFTPQINDLLQAQEYEGARVLKWAPDTDAVLQAWADNDIALLRYADVLLMKAEALWREGNNGAALSLINQLRTTRRATPISSISANGQEILDERGFELYWEGHRRTDLIRFDQFTKGTWWAKEVSEDYRSLYPIPANALSANKNLRQNPGY